MIPACGKGENIMIRRSFGEKAFDIFNATSMTLMMLICIYPMIYVIFASLSDSNEFMRNSGFLFHPVGFSVKAYALVFENPMILKGYFNTIVILILGTSFSVFLTAVGAYVLSRKNLYIQKPLMLLIVFTMFFSGGLIPFYFTVKNLGLMDTRWALIIPTCISTYNLIIMRVSFLGIPDSLEESAKMDGANDFIVLFRIILPLSMPVIAVMILYYGVGIWNSWFNAMIFLRDRELFPLQLILREILIQSDMSNMTTSIGDSDKFQVGETVKYATRVIATLPILLIYPFLQKYFVKGIMIGAVKG